MIDFLFDFLAKVFVCSFIATMVIGLTAPLWAPIALGAAELLCDAFELYGRFEDWLERRAVSRRHEM
jgi:hypothetical protein